MPREIEWTKDDGIPIRTRVRRGGLNRQAVTYLAVAGGGLAVLAVVVTVVALAVVPKVGGSAGIPAFLGGEPSAEREGVNWSVEQMRDYLIKKGHAVSSQGEGGSILMKRANGAVYDISKESGHITAEWKLSYGPVRTVGIFWPATHRRAVWGRFVFEPMADHATTGLDEHLKGVRYAKFSEEEN